MRIEHLNYKVRLTAILLPSYIYEFTQRIVPGMTILGQVVALRDFHMIVALPNQLLGHVPVTNISEAYTKQLDASEHSDAGDDDDMKQDLASLNDMFQVGQFLCCYVSAVHAAAHNEARIRDPMEKASKRVELSLYPTRINANVALEDLLNGMVSIA
jgi:rRNA biogenesis protein RRP5